MEELVVLIFIGLILVVNALIKKAIGGKEGEQPTQTSSSGRGQSQKSIYQASEDQVQDFLEQIQEKQRSAEQQQKSRSRTPAQASTEQTSPRWTSEEDSQKKKQKQKAKEAREQQFERAEKMQRRTGKRAASTSSTRARRTGMSVPGLGTARYGSRRRKGAFRIEREDLSTAVIWSEILRPPVSLRDEIGHRPIETEKRHKAT